MNMINLSLNTNEIKNKYLKYKNKYLEFKSIGLKLSNQIGGQKPLIKDPDRINLFDDAKMKQYLNPIYGIFLCSSGFIPNNFYFTI